MPLDKFEYDPQQKKSKSVLDNTSVVNQAFPGFPDYNNPPSGYSFQITPAVEVVAHCPACGNPIYGPKVVMQGIAPQVQRTCSCSLLPAKCDRKDIASTMRTT